MATESTTVKQELQAMGDDLYPETETVEETKETEQDEQQEPEEEQQEEQENAEDEDQGELPLPPIEQKYAASQAGNHEQAGNTKTNRAVKSPVTQESVTARESAKARELRLTKETLDGMLLCYCEMQELIESDKLRDPALVSFSETEAEAITDMAVDLLIRVFPKLVDRRSDDVTKTRALNYLKIYYQIHKLKQTERRRQEFLDKFIAILRLGEMEEFFVETSIQFNQAIQETCRELDERVNPDLKGSGKPARHRRQR